LIPSRLAPGRSIRARFVRRVLAVTALALVALSVAASARALGASSGSSGAVPAYAGAVDAVSNLEPPTPKPIPLLIVGDSLTRGWHVDGRATWQADFARGGAIALGIGGLKTSDVLHRIQNGWIDSFAPRTIVLLIGTNDLGTGASVDATVAGVRADVDALRDRAPDARIVVLGLLPRGPGDAETPIRRKVAEVNARLAALEHGGAIRFADLTPAFVDAHGYLRPGLFHSDLLHLSSIGYAAFSRALQATLVVSSSS
jgi:lysophospholipase L1-like esterase